MIDPTKLLRSAGLAFALLFLAPVAGIGGAFVGVEAAQAATVSKISVVGNTKVEDSAVINLLSIHVGETVTPQKIDASISALTASGLFKTVSVAMKGSVLVVSVTENPIVASVLFEGNVRFSDANLVAMIDLMNRGTVDQAGLERDTQTILQAYRDAGFTDVVVTTRLDPVGDGRDRVTFVVNEGGRSGIAAINFTGNNSISGWTLKSIIKTHETGWLSWLLKDDGYTQDQLDVDRVLIQQYYANHGFPDAQVTSATAEFNAERKSYFINFTVVEGDTYKYGKIGIETSISGLDANQFTGLIGTREGARFSSAEVARTSQDIAVEASNLGFPFADVRPRIIRDAATGSFAVTYLIDEGQHVYVERVNITGNDKTRDFVIRREVGFAEGDPFNRALVAQAKSNIEALGFFSKVDVSAQQGSAGDKVILNIDVVEQSTGSYGVSLGYDTASGVLGELSLEERNFLGRGQYLKVSVGASQSGRTFDLHFTEPYFMGLKVSSGIDLYHHISDDSATNIYGTTSTGGQVRLGLPITRDLSATVFTGIDQTTISDATTPNSSVFCVGVGCADGLAFTKAWVGYSLNYNTLDDQKHPTEGIVASLNQQYNGVDYSFLKTEAKLRYYMPIWADAGIIGSLKLQGGMINDLNGSLNPIEAFTYSNEIVRGFPSRGLGPMLTTGSVVETLGFTSYAAASVEASFPIPMLPETYGLRGAVWADAAYVAGHSTALMPDGTSVDQPFKSSVGASIIWDSPFGPLRGDFALPLTYSTDEKAHLQYFALTLNNVL
ncbi:MAG: outer membrane protein assembly factor BamA [Devosia sp.]